MKQFETAHYIFHYGEGTLAEMDIEKIADCQESCFRYICDVLKVKPAFKILYYLCESPEEVGRVYGDDEPCNGFAVMPNKIYAVYNREVQCIGFHEDAHIISYTVNRPDCPAIREGLAMYFDRRWWGIHNMDWTAYYIKTGRFLPVDALLDKETFFEVDCSVTYPIMGAFTEYLISLHGIETYMDFYSRKDMALAMKVVFGKTPEELNRDFVLYMSLFRVEEGVERRMDEMMQ